MKSINFLSLSVQILILVNLIPLFGVLYLDWGLYNIMILYWLENLIIGAFNLIKILFASKGKSGLAKKLFVLPFFTMHYGMFCFVHGMFILILFQPGGFFGGSFSPFDDLSFRYFKNLAVAFNWALVAMLLSHGVSLLSNYFGKEEFLNVSVDEQMFQPYQRIMILHITIIVGGFVTMLLGAPILALVFMVLLKTGIDLKAHSVEHEKAQAF